MINPEPYTGDAIFEPVITTLGLKIMSLNLLVDKEDDPVIWTSSVVHKVLKQMYTDTKWGNLDYLIIDMPPGTGGIAITIMNTFPIDGLLVVGTPQDMVSVIVKKVINMAEKLSIPMIGLVENMAYTPSPYSHQPMCPSTFSVRKPRSAAVFSTWSRLSRQAMP